MGHVTLSSLKGRDLRHIALLTGFNTSRTKAEHLLRLPKELSRPRFPKISAQRTKTRILSIDMGIRNLAYCVVDVQHLAPKKTWNRSSGGARSTPISVDDLVDAFSGPMPGALENLTVVAWERTAVSTTENVAREADSSSHGGLREEVVSKESFEPADVARLAYGLVTSVFLPYKPDVVVIERQRHRSSSAPAIFEWTVRVNMLESMLHCVFETLKQQHILHDSGTRGEQGRLDTFPEVHSVSPKKVLSFWLLGEASSRSKQSSNTMRKSKEQKDAKIKIAQKWFSQGMLAYAAEVKSTLNAFLVVKQRKSVTLEKSKASSKKHRPPDTEDETVEDVYSVPAKLTKLDDLADCLLQGVAWVQWELHRRKITELVELK